jgi:hypothetical protein
VSLLWYLPAAILAVLWLAARRRVSALRALIDAHERAERGADITSLMDAIREPPATEDRP